MIKKRQVDADPGRSDNFNVNEIAAVRLLAIPLQPIKAGSIEIRVKLEIHGFMASRAWRIANSEYPWIVMVFMHFFSPDLLDTVTKENHGLYIFSWPDFHVIPGSKNGPDQQSICGR